MKSISCIISLLSVLALSTPEMTLASNEKSMEKLRTEIIIALPSAKATFNKELFNCIFEISGVSKKMDVSEVVNSLYNQNNKWFCIATPVQYEKIGYYTQGLLLIESYSFTWETTGECTFRQNSKRNIDQNNGHIFKASEHLLQIKGAPKDLTQARFYKLFEICNLLQKMDVNPIVQSLHKINGKWFCKASEEQIDDINEFGNPCMKVVSGVVVTECITEI